MSEKPEIDQHLREPDTARRQDGSRSDGRPTTPIGSGVDDGPAEELPTEAPEEQGETPSTEHAPGGDL